MNIVPKEVLWYIFSYAGPSSFGIFRAVCCYWKYVIDSDKFKQFYSRFAINFWLDEYTMYEYNTQFGKQYIPSATVSVPYTFNEFHFSLFDDDDFKGVECPAKFVGFDHVDYIDMFNPDFRFISDILTTAAPTIPDNFHHNEHKIIKQFSRLPNGNNWNMSKIPNAVAIQSVKTNDLDKFFENTQSIIIIAAPPKCTEEEYEKMIAQRSSFYSELNEKQKYGHAALLAGGG